MNTNKHRRLVSVWSFLVLVLAIAPNVTYVGHWPVDQSAGHSHDAPAAATHEEHCHGDTSQCDQPAVTGVSWVAGESSPFALPEPRPYAVQPDAGLRAREGYTPVFTPPPRIALPAEYA